MTARALEIETKYDVTDDLAVPDLAPLPGVARLSEPEVLELRAAYFDTPDLLLGRAGITLRRRTGGEDEGWHLKLPVRGDRYEISAPLSRSVHQPPIALRRIVGGVTGSVALVNVLSLVTTRRQVVLMDHDATALATFCDDAVRATEPRPEGDLEETWREWELEALAAKDKLLRKADQAFRHAGAKRSRHASKPARALTLPAPPTLPPLPRVDKSTSERELLQAHLTRLVLTVHGLDPLVRANTPGAVHQMRVAGRQLRSTVGAFAKQLDDSATAIAGEVQWLGRVLGRARDLEVLQEHLDRMLSDLPAELVRDNPRRWIDAHLRQLHREALREMSEAMSSERYLALLGALDTWEVTAPWSDTKDRPARQRTGRALDRAWDGLVRAAGAAADAEGTTDYETRLHDVRKAAKTARYAAEAVQPAVGSRARQAARAAKQIHHTLGEHQDAVVAGTMLLQLADLAREQSRDGFTLGVLRARTDQEAEEHATSYRRQWKRAKKLI